jgi:hypothetical protein
MTTLPSITEWIEMALTTVSVRPDFHENLREDLEGWAEKAMGLQVR